MKWLLRKYYLRKAIKIYYQINSCCEYINQSLHAGQDCSAAIERRDKLYADLSSYMDKIDIYNKTI